MTVAHPLVLGTAGHVDHGKTALVTALTGADTDRLAEEKRRGISIELGYARLSLPSQRQLSVIDVPGHERFVQTMVAGATGIDLFLLCIAADDGVMPQTREHLAVLRALGIEHGVVAITRSDLADPEPARTQAAKLLPSRPIVSVVAPTGAGLDQLLAALDNTAARVPERDPTAGSALLHIDRSFTLKGHGTIVTGTLWSGQVANGDGLVVLPQGRPVRVRSVQVHDEPVALARSGQRVALGLAGIAWRDLARGDVIAHDTSQLSASFRIDAAIELDTDTPPLQRGDRVRVHHGTRHATARVISLQGDLVHPGKRTLCQLRCQTPLIPVKGDRLVIRQIAPPDTIGGGVVIDPAAPKHGPSTEIVEKLGEREHGQRPSTPRPPTEKSPPADKQNQPPPDATARRIAELLLADGDQPCSDNTLAEAAGLTLAELAPRLRALEYDGAIVRVGRNLHFHKDPLARLAARALAACRRDGTATIASLRDELATSRRYAQAILEHLDSQGMTIRRGDTHVLRRNHQPGQRSDDGVEPSKRRTTPP